MRVLRVPAPKHTRRTWPADGTSFVSIAAIAAPTSAPSRGFDVRSSPTGRMLWRMRLFTARAAIFGACGGRTAQAAQDVGDSEPACTVQRGRWRARRDAGHGASPSKNSLGVSGY